MSLINEVVAAVEELGHGTADDVFAEMGWECGYTRQQVLSALQNAKQLKRLTNDGKPGGSSLVVYRPAPKPKGPRPPCSVWEYAERIGGKRAAYEIPVFLGSAA